MEVCALLYVPDHRRGLFCSCVLKRGGTHPKKSHSQVHEVVRKSAFMPHDPSISWRRIPHLSCTPSASGPLLYPALHPT